MQQLPFEMNIVQQINDPPLSQIQDNVLTACQIYQCVQ